MNFNKRGGSIAIGASVLIALFLAVYALNIFYSSNQINSDSVVRQQYLMSGKDFLFEGINKIALDSFKESIRKSESKGSSIQSVRNNFETEVLRHEGLFGYVGSGNFFAKIRNGDYEIKKAGEKYQLIVNGLFVESSFGEEFIKKEFNLFFEQPFKNE